MTSDVENCKHPGERGNYDMNCDCSCVPCSDFLIGHQVGIDREHYAREREREQERTGRRICPRCDDFMWQCSDCKTWYCYCSGDGSCYCREDY